MTDILDLLDTAGLTGRGGAAFSTAVKVRAARDGGAAVIVKACDGEIGAAKDAYVVEHHLAELVRGPSWSPRPAPAACGMPRTAVPTRPPCCSGPAST